VPPGDAVMLADAIIALLEDGGEARSMGTRGAAVVEQEFGWESIARQMMSVY